MQSPGLCVRIEQSRKSSCDDICGANGSVIVAQQELRYMFF